MKYTVISGSHRQNSQSLKVSKYLQGRLQELLSLDSSLIKLENNPLPLWDESIWTENRPHWDEKWTPISKELQSSDGLIVVCPEWGGMVPSGLKNFFLLCQNAELGHKPGLIVSISGSCNGAYPVSELRMSSTKNNRLIYIPDHLIIREVTDVLNDGPAKDEDETYLRNRIDYSLNVFHEYGKALKLVRDSGVIDFETYTFGM